MGTAVIGGTGSLGRLVVDELVRRGEEVRILSRTPPATAVPGASHHPVDLRTGGGLDAALRGVRTVVDAANGTAGAHDLLVAGTGRVLAAGAAVGVGHHLLISIVGCDRVPLAYYAAKAAQERAVEGGPVPWSILRATQFHGLLAGMFGAAARLGVRPRVRVPLQPVDPSVVARALADAVAAGPGGRLPDLAGPRREEAAALADAWSAATGRGRVPVPVPLPGRAGRALRSGVLCAPDHASDGPTFAEWLAATAPGVGGRA